jgi:hypothetical protein
MLQSQGILPAGRVVHSVPGPCSHPLLTHAGGGGGFDVRAQYGTSLLPPGLQENTIPVWSLRSMMHRHRVSETACSDSGE